MLKIHFGSPKSEIKRVDDVFFMEFKDEWLQDKFIQRVLKDIDGVTVQENGSIKHPILGYKKLEELSIGVKNLILAYKLNRVIDASYCGDNCAKWLLEIGNMKDLKITLCHIMVFPQDVPFNCYITNNHKYVNTQRGYVDEALRFLLRDQKEV